LEEFEIASTLCYGVFSKKCNLQSKLSSSLKIFISMLQPLLERTFSFETLTKIQIDNLDYILKNIDPKLSNPNTLSLTLWGRKPNASIIEDGRIVKLEGHFWKPDMNSLVILLKNGEHISPVLFDDNELSEFCSNLKLMSQIQSISIEMSTQLNPTVVYSFS
jgi:hypothetical protein